MAARKSITPTERLHKVAEYVNERQHVSIDELVLRFGVSGATIRRDLGILSDQKRIERTHGGAQINRNAPPEPPVLQRSNQQSNEKSRIGLHVASMIQDGETVFIGSGSTALEVAKHLGGHDQLTIVSNSLLVINELIRYPNFDLIALGGVIRKSEMSFIGHLTEQALSQVRTDRVIMGIHAVDVEFGLTNDYLEETLSDRAILKNGREVIIVADHTKCGRVSKAFLAPIESIDILVTGVETPDEFVDSLMDKGIQAIRV